MSTKKARGCQAFTSVLLGLSENRVMSLGPNGEPPTPLVSFGLSRAESDRIGLMHAKVAIVMHYLGNDWSQAQIAGLRDELTEMAVDIVAVTDAGFDPAKQVADIHNVLSEHPDVIVSAPTDPVATAAAYREAAEQGVKLVFADNVPRGFRPGKDYVSVVSADNYANGVASADLMAQAVHGRGRVAAVFHDADFFVTQQRYEAFRSTIENKYPEIALVDEVGVRGPDFALEARQVVAGMLERAWDINGIWAVWDVPAEGVVAAVREAGRTDIVITTIDLGLNVAMEVARGGLVYGLGAQRPFDQGVAEAELAGYALLGKPAPPYVVLPALPVSRVSVLEAWESVYHQPPPQRLIEAAT